MRRAVLIVLAGVVFAGRPALAQPWEPNGRSWRYSGPDGDGWGYRSGGVTYETHYPPRGPAVRCMSYRTNGGYYTRCD